MKEIKELVTTLAGLGLPFKFHPFQGGYQVILYNANGEKLDDAIWHPYSHGYKDGLLETYVLGDCEGYETALDVADGWYRMYCNQ